MECPPEKDCRRQMAEKSFPLQARVQKEERAIQKGRDGSRKGGNRKERSAIG